MNYYNEYDPKAAAWIQELINQKLIPPGIVDTRSITDVRADDLREFAQCHFFAGVSGWSYALEIAGVDPNEPIWSGSCPCQSFSSAGKQKGFDDARDLWPVFFNLIKECRPPKIFGEQVENSIKHGWLDRVYSDLEAENYAVGAAVLGAHSVGAPHMRQRLYWGAERVSDCNERRFSSHSPIERESCIVRSGADLCISNSARGQCEQPIWTQGNEFQRSADDLPDCRMAENSIGGGCGGRRDGDSAGQGRQIQTPGLGACGELADDNNQRCEEQCIGIAMDEIEQREAAGIGVELRSLPSVPWSQYAPIYCRDNKVRRVPAESVLFGVADGISEGVDAGGDIGLHQASSGFPLCKKDAFKKGEIAMLLKGFGNAIVPEVAAEFIKAFKG